MKRLVAKIVLFVAGIVIVDSLISGLLFRGLVKFTDLSMGADILFVGHSHTQCAIDSSIVNARLKGRAVTTKLAMHGMQLADRLAFVNYYINSSSKKPRCIVFDIDETVFSADRQNLNTHTRFYPFMDDRYVRHYISEHSGSYEIIARRILKTLRYNNSWILVRALKGTVGVVDNMAPDRRLDRPENVPLISAPVVFDGESERLFLEFVEFAERNKISVIFAYYPRLLSNKVDISNRLRVRDRMQELLGNREYLVLDYSDEFGRRCDVYSDVTHLNRNGQKLLSSRMAEELANLIETGAL